MFGARDVGMLSWQGTVADAAVNGTVLVTLADLHPGVSYNVSLFSVR